MPSPPNPSISSPLISNTVYYILKQLFSNTRHIRLLKKLLIVSPSSALPSSPSKPNMPPIWFTTHGIGAIKDTDNSFSITSDGGSAKISPTSDTSDSDLKGWVHYTIPNPNPDNSSLKAIQVDFSSQSASVDGVKLHFANSLKFSVSDLQQTSSFNLDIASSSAVYSNKGIAVSLYLSFDDKHSWLKLQSVGVQG
ncbi:unnamed protein product [Clonostachys byssicola]|uniref:Uncharacterized protein n=1 Tax=Clonostachys byssicola TaxID=160290 RepID=A0A9N9UTU0_9HYPO|nr:unnamed protein product [Clonostachys byssicola]